MNPHKIPLKIINEITLPEGTVFDFLFDQHVGSTNATMTPGQIRIRASERIGFTIFGGDNTELRNSKFKDLAKQIELDKYIAEIVGLLKLPGNHDGDQKSMRWCIRIRVVNERGEVIKVYLVVHGDWESNPERYYKHRGEPMGAGFLKRGLWVNALEFAESFKPNQFSPDVLNRCLQTLVEGNGDALIMGHKHFRQLEKRQHGGCEIYGMPRVETSLRLG